MKTHIVLPICYVFLVCSCLDSDNEDALDLTAPSISANEGESSILPKQFYKATNTTNEIPLSFQVEDDSGIREIKIESHSGFDGHTHKSLLAKNSRFKLFRLNKRITSEDIENQKKFVYSTAEGSNIYLDERNSEISSGDLILAGPYHFSIQATDIEGNQTRYQDNSIYHTTLYINRSYAPQVEIQNLNTADQNISGRIYRNLEAADSSDITFLWIYIEAGTQTNSESEGTILKEWIWGNSNWPHQFRPDSGDPLPDAQELVLEELFDKDTDFYTSLDQNKLVIWAEDTNGNITVDQFNN